MERHPIILKNKPEGLSPHLKRNPLKTKEYTPFPSGEGWGEAFRTPFLLLTGTYQKYHTRCLLTDNIEEGTIEPHFHLGSNNDGCKIASSYSRRSGFCPLFIYFQTGGLKGKV